MRQSSIPPLAPKRNVGHVRRKVERIFRFRTEGVWPIDRVMATILLVDDDLSLLRVQADYFRHYGYVVECAGNGKIALELAKKRRFDVCVTDIIMPEQEGLETIRRMRKLHPDVQIVAVSGGGMMNAGDYLDMALRFGAHAALAKPYTILQLQRTIDSVFVESKKPSAAAG